MLYFHGFEGFRIGSSKGFKPEQASLLFNIASIYNKLNQNTTALNYLEKAAIIQSETYHFSIIMMRRTQS